MPGPSSSCVPWSSTPPGASRPSPISRCGRCCLQASQYLGHPETFSFRGYLPTAHSLACLRFAESVNANCRGLMTRGSVRRGEALLAGMLRCGQCGRRLHVHYSGASSACVSYGCRGAQNNHGTRGCISFGGARVDAVVGAEVEVVVALGVALRHLSSRRHGSGKRRGVSSHTGRVTDQCQTYTQSERMMEVTISFEALRWNGSPWAARVPAVHDVERAGFRNQNVEDVDIMYLPVGDGE